MNRARAHLSKAELIGRLGQQPELQYTDAGTPYARLSVVTSESFTNKLGAIRRHDEWHRAVAWGEEATRLTGELVKGDSVVIAGSLRINGYEKDGIKHRSSEVNVESVRANKDDLPGKNEVRILGTVREEPKFRELEGGKAMISLSVATRIASVGADGTSHEREDWHSVTLWGKKAQAARDIHAGDTVAVNGNLRHRTIDTEEGGRRHLTSIEGYRFQVLEKARDRGGLAASESPGGQEARTSSAARTPSEPRLSPGAEGAEGNPAKGAAKRKARTTGKGLSLGD
jgi:single stranded DNA-binding protein